MLGKFQTPVPAGENDGIPQVQYEFLPDSRFRHVVECLEPSPRTHFDSSVEGTFTMDVNQRYDEIIGGIRDLHISTTPSPEYVIVGTGYYVLIPEGVGMDVVVRVNDFPEVTLISELRLGGNFPAIGMSVFQEVRGNDCFSLRLLARPVAEDAVRFFRRGDANSDGRLDISDPIAILDHLFLGEFTPACLDACDGNDDGAIDLSDPVYLLGVLFLGERPGPSLSVFCALDRTEDELDCGGQSACLQDP